MAAGCTQFPESDSPSGNLPVNTLKLPIAQPAADSVWRMDVNTRDFRGPEHFDHLCMSDPPEPEVITTTTGIMNI